MYREQSVRWKTVIPTFRLLFYSYSVQVQNLNTFGIQYLRTFPNLIIFCIWSKFVFRHSEEFTHIKIRYSSQSYCGDIEGVGDEVHHIPHVADVLPQPHVPQLLDLAPDETRDPGEDAALHQAGRRAPVFFKYNQQIQYLFHFWVFLFIKRVDFVNLKQKFCVD